MITSYKYEGKNYDEILESALKELNLNLEDVYLKKEEEEAKLFKNKKYFIEIIKKEDVITYIKEYISELSKNMNIEINCEVKEKDNIISVLLVSENNALLIGKDGKNLDAIQLLLRQTINNKTEQNIKISLDISGYKSKKTKNLEYEIKKICYEVLKTKVDVKLDPMNSYQRRIVHTIVSKFDELSSSSVGESPNRYTIISYKDIH